MYCEGFEGGASYKGRFKCWVVRVEVGKETFRDGVVVGEEDDYVSVVDVMEKMHRT